MRPVTRRFLLSTVLLAALAGCRDSTPNPATTTAVPDAVLPPPTAPSKEFDPSRPARLVMTTRSLDFGVMMETDERSLMVPFHNDGGRELIIEDVSTNCGCARPKLEQRRFAPGESGELEVIFDPTGPGEQTKQITIVSNTTPAEIVRIDVRADIKAFLMVEPPQAMLGVIPLRQKKTITFTLTSIDPEFELIGLSMTNPYLIPTWQPHPVTGTAGPERIVEVEIPASVPWGSLFSWLNITVKGRPTPDAEPITYRRRVRVQGQVFGELHADPDTFRFGTAPGEAFERVVRLWRPSEEPFRFIGASMPGGALPDSSLEAREISPSEYEIVLKARAGNQPGRFTANVTIQTDVPGEEEIVVRIVGRIRTQPAGVP